MLHDENEDKVLWSFTLCLVGGFRKEFGKGKEKEKEKK